MVGGVLSYGRVARDLAAGFLVASARGPHEYDLPKIGAHGRLSAHGESRARASALEHEARACR